MEMAIRLLKNVVYRLRKKIEADPEHPTVTNLAGGYSFQNEIAEQSFNTTICNISMIRTATHFTVKYDRQSEMFIKYNNELSTKRR
jgi:hypothetical protein